MQSFSAFWAPTTRNCGLPCCCPQVLHSPSLTACFSWLIKLMLFSLSPFSSGVLWGTSLELPLHFLAASPVPCYLLQPWLYLLWWIRWVWFTLRCLRCPCTVPLCISTLSVATCLCAGWQQMFFSAAPPFPLTATKVFCASGALFFPVCSLLLTLIIYVNFFFRAFSALQIHLPCVSTYPAAPEQSQWRCLWCPSLHYWLYPHAGVLP